MNVSLTPEMEEMVRKAVESGKYESECEVVREALEILMGERDYVTGLRKDDIRRMIDEGLDDQREGRMIDGETFFAELLAGSDAADLGSKR